MPSLSSTPPTSIRRRRRPHGQVDRGDHERLGSWGEAGRGRDVDAQGVVGLAREVEVDVGAERHAVGQVGADAGRVERGHGDQGRLVEGARRDVDRDAVGGGEGAVLARRGDESSPVGGRERSQPELLREVAVGVEDPQPDAARLGDRVVWRIADGGADAAHGVGR